MTFEFQWESRISEISREAWNRLVSDEISPFLSWEWLNSLEQTGCVGGNTGWEPMHLAVYENGILVAAAPFYLKHHSRGEFVFDQEWAEVSFRIGVDYYPKLLGMSPFTPAGNYRFLLEAGQDKRMCSQAMLTEIDRMCKASGVNSFHILHGASDWVGLMEDLGMSKWLHHALVWENRGYESFDHYLAGFKSRRRKNIKRERRVINEQGLSFRMIPGDEAPVEYFLLMYYLYASTCDKFYNWSHYLNLDFFSQLRQACPQHINLVAAFSPSEEIPVAMSFLVQKGEWLYGRYWGCREAYEHLHFETCYYQAIEWAIKKGIRYFDAGSGNASHKQRRGFPASPRYSLHRHYHPAMARIWDMNIERINNIEEKRIEMINQSGKG